MSIARIPLSFLILTLAPFSVSAQSDCNERSSGRTTSTVVGAGLGAILGGAVAGRDDRAAGAVIGGLGGALLGNQIGRTDNNCARSYGYYDNRGDWHASGLADNVTTGYYDRRGAWINGAPEGHYDSRGNWVRTGSGSEGAGFRDHNGDWVPASSAGYHGSDGRWYQNVASGHYNQRGVWTPGVTSGRYDDRGRWISGPSTGQRYVDDGWVSASQVGYYGVDGVWRPGMVSGYYDAAGRWVSTEAVAPYRNGAGYMGDAASSRGSFRTESRRLEDRIVSAVNADRFSDAEGARALREIAILRNQERRMPHPGGALRARDARTMDLRLIRLDDSLPWRR
jgi:hypothetical protein